MRGRDPRGRPALLAVTWGGMDCVLDKMVADRRAIPARNGEHVTNPVRLCKGDSRTRGGVVTSLPHQVTPMYRITAKPSLVVNGRYIASSVERFPRALGG